jgi:hypothetical protein
MAHVSDSSACTVRDHVETTCTMVFACVTPTLICPLVTLLGQRDVLPTRMQTVYSSLHAIFANSGSLRNAAGNQKRA